MAELVRTVNLTATFAKLKRGDSINIGFCDATESNVRRAASMYSQKNKIELKVSVRTGADAIVVTRKS